ncbi:MAG: phosphate ABC transporter ATP-binding protein [Marmoricola sp.]
MSGGGGAPAIEVRDLSAWYGDDLAVDAVSMRIAPHAVTAVIGPSGCGKSTFLRCLNRMHEVTAGARVSGSVVVGEQSVYESGTDPVTVRRRLGMVFQRPNPFPHLSVAENVLAGLRLEGTVDDADGLVERCLRRTNLWEETRDRLDRPAGGLSGGQQQRLCIARAVALESDVLLMDEPTSALDPDSTAAVEELIGELRASYTIVLVTHDLAQAARVSDETAFLSARPAPGDGASAAGRLVEMGATAKIFHDPDQRATAAYVADRSAR